MQVKHIAEDPPCSCSHRFSIEYLSEGRYRLGDRILFIRVSAVSQTFCFVALELSVLFNAPARILKTLNFIHAYIILVTLSFQALHCLRGMSLFPDDITDPHH